MTSPGPGQRPRSADIAADWPDDVLDASAAAMATARSRAAARHPIRVIVLGETHRGDDGVAFIAVREALRDIPVPILERLDVRETGQLDPADLVELADPGAAIVVDAVVGVPPGEIVVVPLEALALAGAAPGRSDGVQPRSSHVLPVDQLVALAAAVRGSAPPGVLVGVGASGFDLGAPMSPPVVEAVPALAATIRTEIDRIVDGLAG